MSALAPSSLPWGIKWLSEPPFEAIILFVRRANLAVIPRWGPGMETQAGQLAMPCSFFQSLLPSSSPSGCRKSPGPSRVGLNRGFNEHRKALFLFTDGPTAGEHTSLSALPSSLCLSLLALRLFWPLPGTCWFVPAQDCSQQNAQTKISVFRDKEEHVQLVFLLKMKMHLIERLNCFCWRLGKKGDVKRKRKCDA